MHASSPARYYAFVLATAGLGLVHASSGQEITLRHHWTQGETVRYRATQGTTSEADFPGAGPITVTTNLSQIQQLTVDKVAADGAATIRMTFESLKTDVTTPAGVLSYDSAAPPAGAGNPMADMMAKSYGAIVGRSITLAVSPSGEIRSVEDLAVLAGRMTENMPPNVAYPMEDALRALVEQCFVALPGRVVRPADTWNQITKTTAGYGTVDSAKVFVLKGVETRNGRSLAHVTVTGKKSVTLDPDVSAKRPNLMGVSVAMGPATFQGELLFDVKTGRLHRSSIQSTRTDEQRMTAPDGSPVTLTSVSKTTSAVELIEK